MHSHYNIEYTNYDLQIERNVLLFQLKVLQGKYMIDKKNHIHISITSTGRCNRGCKYCHFYASHKREDIDHDMEWSVFTGYVSYIKYLMKDGYSLSVRFSGGEPLFIKNEQIYAMSDYLYEQTGIKPYVMTNGKLISKETIAKAADHNIRAFVISCENPFKESEGAEPVSDVLKKYIELQNDTVPLELGLVLIENSEFKNMKKVADYFYEHVGIIPPFSEKNFDTYERPTTSELEDLKENVKSIIRSYNGVTDIHLFPYIIPELYNNTDEEYEEYLIEFPLDDVYGYSRCNHTESLRTMNEIFDRNNIPYTCPDTECELSDYCKVIKWVWFDATQYKKGEKLEDYCKMKKILVEAYYEALYEE